MSIIRQFKGRPSAKAAIYRAVPSGLTTAEKLADLEKAMAANMRRGVVPEGESNVGSVWYNKAHAERARLRALPPEPETKTDINPGDWVTINRQYAKDHGESTLRGKYKIIRKMVRADELYTDGNSQLALSSPNVGSFGQEVSDVGSLSQDLDALRALYDSTSGSVFWVHRNGWADVGTDPCLSKWFGVVCNDVGRVTALDLRNNNLTGFIPDAISRLRNFKFDSERIGGSLPQRSTKAFCKPELVGGFRRPHQPLIAFVRAFETNRF
jgi:hypothetical protein